MIVGIGDDDPDFIRMVEALCATVMVDDHHTGSRSIWKEGRPAEDF